MTPFLVVLDPRVVVTINGTADCCLAELRCKSYPEGRVCNKHRDLFSPYLLLVLPSSSPAKVFVACASTVHATLLRYIKLLA